MIIACVLVLAPRLHQIHAKSVSARLIAARVSARGSHSILEKQRAELPRITLQLEPWTFDAAPAVEIESQDFTFYLAKQEVSPPTQAQVDALSHDLSFFSETEFAPSESAPPRPRLANQVVQFNSIQPNDFHPRRAMRTARMVNYVRPLILASSFEYNFATHALDVPIRPDNHPIVRHPQTSDGDGSTIVVGENPEPKPVTGGDEPGTGSTGGIGGVGSGVGGLPPPTGNSIPEPSVILPLICIATLLSRRTKQWH
jgi:hypothetical protein